LGFLDLHSHVLPALDDGSPDTATSLAMLRALAAAGFDTVYATPHQRSGMFMPSAEAIGAAFAAATAALAGAGPTLALAAENMWDDVFYERSRTGEVPAYGGGPAFLVEFPVAELPVGVFEQLFQFRLKGKLPVLAHPERYRALWTDAAAIDRLRSSCALVVDLGAVAGYHGRKEAKLARALVTGGIAHAVASDAHTVGDVSVATEGIAWIRKHVGDAAVGRLLDDNPRRIVAGEHPDG
jgi:protein-tyrosine phosphatase